MFRKNNKTVNCAISGLPSLSGYTAVLSCKKNKDDSAALFEITGTITDMTATFEITHTHTDIEQGDYYFDITISSADKVYTVSLGKIIIKQRVKN